MREALALVLLIIVINCVADPAAFGAWLKQVEDARYLDIDYK